MQKKAARVTTHRAVEKSLDVLMAFTPYNRELGTNDINEKLGISKPTANRLLHVLTKKGFLRQNPKTKKFQLGQSTMILGMAIKKSLETDLVLLAKPYMEELRDLLNETVALEIFSGIHTVLAYLAYGDYRTNLAGNMGDVLAVHAAAGAKAILAFSSPRVRERVLNGPLTSLTPNTITDPKFLQEQFQKIQKRGFSFDNEEHDIGTKAIGAPIFDCEGKPVAGLVVAGPAQRITFETDSVVALRVKETALTISKQLYYNPLQERKNSDE